MAISVVVLAGADRVQRVVGEHGVLALERLMGLVLTALAVEMLLSGIRTFVTSLH
jgi:small neutral amino acid transporter SnatA (MarC family)